MTLEDAFSLFSISQLRGFCQALGVANVPSNKTDLLSLLSTIKYSNPDASATITEIESLRNLREENNQPPDQPYTAAMWAQPYLATMGVTGLSVDWFTNNKERLDLLKKVLLVQAIK
jgi:hypothetical protein